MKGPDRQTLEYYSRETARFMETGPEREWIRDPIRRFAKVLRPGADVLELGCGGGHDAMAMISLGLNVEATDGTPGIAKVAEQRLHKPVRVMKFHEIDAEESYDGIWASATLLHVDRADFVDILSRVHRALKPGGMLYASFKTGQPEGRDKFGRYFNYPSEEELRRDLSKAGMWSSIEIEKNSGYGSDQLLTDWLHCFAKKVAAKR